MARKVRQHWTQKEWKAYGERVGNFWRDLHELFDYLPPYAKAKEIDALLRVRDKLAMWTLKIENIAEDYQESGGQSFFAARRAAEQEKPQ